MLKYNRGKHMALAKFESFLFPVLNYISNNNNVTYKDLARQIPINMRLSVEDLNEKVDSRDEPKYINRINWSVTYLFKAGLIDRVSRGSYNISEEGLKALKSKINIDLDYLKKITSFKKFQQKKEKNSNSVIYEKEKNEDLSPTEELFLSYSKIKEATCEELLERLQKTDPYNFENIVSKLIKKMGYGGFESEPILVGGAGDKGVDAIINEDALGLSKIYIQAKRYSSDNLVSHKIVREFVGAVALKGGNKGILITTSSFTNDALKEKENSKSNIILIDGKFLTSLLYDYGVGLTEDKVIKIMKIDADYLE
jgi:restriction system protein